MFYLTKVVVLFSVFCAVAIAAPYQELPSKPGYVPVYIRIGNTPLGQINPQLVEAFNEDEESIQTQNEFKSPKEVEIAVFHKVSQKTESMKREEENTNVKTKEFNGKTAINTESKLHGKAENQEKESIASDIAEFTGDDIKTLADNLNEN